VLHIQYFSKGEKRYRSDIKQHQSQANPEHHAGFVINDFIAFCKPAEVYDQQDQ
jgi:hypothetical protein